MISTNDIIKVVIDYFHIDESCLSEKSRCTELVKPRHLAMYFCRFYTNESFASIGRTFSRNHASVLHAIKSVENQNETDKRYYIQFKELQEKIKLENKMIEEITDSEVFQENSFYTNLELNN